MPEIRVAAGTATFLRFDAPLDRASVEVDGRTTRFKLVDVGERTLILEPSIEPVASERLVVRVRFKDGASPSFASFALVSHPSQVDKEVEVVRHLRTREELETELEALRSQREANAPADLALSGRLDGQGVQGRRITLVSGAQDGLTMQEGMGFRATRWTLASLHLRNLPGQKPWTVREARLTRGTGGSVKVLSVRMDRPQLAPGETGRVVVTTEAPYWNSGEVFLLELVGTDGRRFSIDVVKL